MSKIDSKIDKELSLSFVKKHCPKVLQTFKKNETKSDVLKRITHLYLNNKWIQEIGDLRAFTNLTVLYLYENKIQKITNLNHATNLTHLYLQRNEIRKIENLNKLIKLKKLYLGYNRICVVEGLERLCSLVELHLEKQHIDKSDSLCFDPRSILGIRQTLKVLNISDNNINTLAEIKNLSYLEVLLARNNNLTNLEEAADHISSLMFLKELTLLGNPISSQLKYRDRLIIKSFKLQTIDNKEISENTRIFLKHFEREKINNAKNGTKRISDSFIPEEFSNISSGLQSELKKSINQEYINIEPDLKMVNTLENDGYLAWNKLQNSVGSRAQVKTAIPRRRKNVIQAPSSRLELDMVQ